MQTNNGNGAAQPRITPERFWHERAVEHQQRLIIIGLLTDIRTLQQQQTDLLRRLLERSGCVL
jgi:hypothetical protein